MRGTPEIECSPGALNAPLYAPTYATMILVARGDWTYTQALEEVVFDPILRVLCAGEDATVEDVTRMRKD